MPVQGRPTAPSFLHPIDHEATVPFSELFNSGFDRATVDATTQLADRSIFVAPNGRRYRFESIPEPTAGSVSGQPASSGPAPSPSPAPSRPVHNYNHDHPPAYRRPPIPSIAAAHSLPVASSLPAYNTSASWGRSPSNASYQSYSPSGYTGQGGRGRGPVAAVEPNDSAEEMTTMMSQVNIHRFSATPLYGESDGGAQAATTLTDPDMAPQASPMISHAQPQHIRPSSQHQYSQPKLSSSYAAGCSPTGGAPIWTNVDYVNYTQQANYHVQTSRQAATAPTGLPSLVGESMPIVHSPSSPSHSHHRASDPMISRDAFSSPAAPVSPEKEFYDGAYDSALAGYPYLPPPPTSSSSSSTIVGQVRQLYHQPSQQHLSVSPHHASPLPALALTHSAPPSVTGMEMGRQPSYATTGGQSIRNGSTSGIAEYEYDTLTPVVVYPSHDSSSQHASGGPAPSMSSDGGSTGRDNVLPGEDVLFDG